ncbi:thioesterase family protein [Microbacterium sp. No. 7]|uniref:thioesterase family protein n=1 Tax=Microbacterium sp. No. 7 TaxID=1714373 RepID=UPI0006D044CD|nr:thioesterase family protein [Microbacterium sp. No. 7]ALJ21131.1 hypothetical protein AOA12_14965 [Microbacterium sp. No. 7]
MPFSTVGVSTHHSRVESWECDFNGHWNTRFYVRAFQCASELVAAGEGVPQRQWHLRFHGELRSGAAVEVRSARVAGGEHDGEIVHLLLTEGRLSATALERGSDGRGVRLPSADADVVAPAFPRSLVAPPPLPWTRAAADLVAHVGTVRPAHTDHTGALLFEEVIRAIAHAVHHQVVSWGYTVEFSERTGVGRMLAEMRLTWLGPCRAGDALRVASRLTDVAEKSFQTAHCVQRADGTPVVLAEQRVLAVDLHARRATSVPGFVQMP